MDLLSRIYLIFLILLLFESIVNCCEKHGDDTSIKYLNDQKIETNEHRYKRNVKNFKLPVPTTKVITNAKTTTKSNAPLIKKAQSIPLKNVVPNINTKQLNLNMSNKTLSNVTKIENVTSTFIDIFKARNELIQNKTANTTTREKKKVPAYSAPIIVFFKGLKFKDGCEYANCDATPSADFKLNSHPSGIANISEGLIVSKCGKMKTFFLSRKTIQQPSVWEYCCGLGMIPAVIETREEHNCIYDAYLNYTDDFYSKKKKYQDTFIINYAEIDITKRYFIACPDKIEIPEDIWAKGQPDNIAGMQTCIAVNFNGPKNDTGLDDISGQDVLNVMCEIQIKPKKAQSSLVGYTQHMKAQLSNNALEKYSCENKLKECKILSANATYKFSDPKKVNLTEGILITNCSSRKHFFLSNIQMSSYNSHKLCCALGMSPATIETRDEFNCIYNQFKTYPDKLFPKKTFTLAYYDEFLTRDFKTCLDEFEIPENMYPINIPDNSMGNQNCMCAVLGGGIRTLDLGFNDYSCTDMHNVMCERITPPNEKKNIPYSKYVVENYNATRQRNISNICDVNRCNDTKVEFNPKVLKKKKKETDTGVYYAGCSNKVYYFSTQEVRAHKMWNFCCNLGMVPATIQTRQELLCLYSAYKNIARKEEKLKGKMQFLINYIDFSLNYTFTSCPDKLEVPANLWCPNAPDNIKGQENCVSVHFKNSHKLLGLNDVSCEVPYFVLCEVIDIAESTSIRENPDSQY